MQTILIELDSPAMDLVWFRAAKRECIKYGEHGIQTEINSFGRVVCFNCRGRL